MKIEDSSNCKPCTTNNNELLLSRCPFYKMGDTVYPLIDVLITLPIPLVPIITLYSKTFIVALKAESDKDLVNDRLNRTKVRVVTYPSIRRLGVSGIMTSS